MTDAALTSPDASLWSPAHAGLLDGLFGEGYVMPGGAEAISLLARPIGLSRDHSLLLVGAGTGGPVISLAAEFGVSVAGFEAVPAFAAAASCRIRQAGLNTRASVAPWSSAAPAFRPEAYHHALALMPLGGTQPAKTLGAIGEAIRPGGHLVLLELVAEPPSDADETLMKAWLKLDRRPAGLPAEIAVTGLLKELGFDVRMVEDMTRTHLRAVVAGWQRLLRTMVRRPSRATAAILLAEAERCLSCSQLMQAGRLRLVRWHAIQNIAHRLDLGAVKLEIMVAVQFRNWRDAMAGWETLTQAQAGDAEVGALRAFIQTAIARDKRDLPSDIRRF